jgi:hypothetical protein
VLPVDYFGLTCLCYIQIHIDSPSVTSGLGSLCRDRMVLEFTATSAKSVTITTNGVSLNRALLSISLLKSLKTEINNLKIFLTF